jgi:hypothetical protein
LFSANLGPLKTELVRAPSLSILFLFVATTLGVYKSKVQQQPNNATPFGVKIFFTAIATALDGRPPEVAVPAGGSTP